LFGEHVGCCWIAHKRPAIDASRAAATCSHCSELLHSQIRVGIGLIIPPRWHRVARLAIMIVFGSVCSRANCTFAPVLLRRELVRGTIEASEGSLPDKLDCIPEKALCLGIPRTALLCRTVAPIGRSLWRVVVLCGAHCSLARIEQAVRATPRRPWGSAR